MPIDGYFRSAAEAKDVLMLAIVTGASRGLGRLCAGEVAAHGANLLLVARDQMALAEVVAEIRQNTAAVK
jgi:short-subunit dehydrogenase